MIEIKGMDKAEVLRRLYNRARPQGMGFLQFKPGDMSIEDARAIVGARQVSPMHDLYFDYVAGRVMKVDIGGDEFDDRLYNRDNGPDAALEALTEPD